MSSAPETRPRRIVLIGMMGSGKTTVGRLIADSTGWPFYDNDETLLSLSGMTPKELVGARGEAEMRLLEDEALDHALSQPAPSIIDAAGGTILSAKSRAALRDAFVVWLRAAPDTLLARAHGADHRPWLDRGVAWFRAADAARRPLYTSVADLIVDTDGRAPEDVAAEVMERISI